MKSILLLTLALGFGAASTFGQGTVNVINSSASLVTAQGLTTNNLAPVGTEIEVFYQPGGGSGPAPVLSNGIVNLGAWEAGTLFNGNPQAMTTHNGRFSNGTITTGTDVAPGAAAWLTVVGWTGGYADLQTAVNDGAYVGESTVFEPATGDVLLIPPGTPTLLTASNAPQGFLAGTPFQGIALTPSPEPSSMAVGAIGAAALLFIRRRPGQPKR